MSKYFDSASDDLYETHSEFRASRPFTSFPANITDQHMADFGVYPVDAEPLYNAVEEKIVLQPAIQIDGVWRRKWQIVSLPPEQIAANQVALIESRRVKSVTMRQARLALLQANLLSQVNTAITNSGDAAKIEWEYAQTVDRNSALVQGLTAALGLTESQLDALFTSAASL